MLLQDAQQLRLQVRRQLADLVQEDAAAVRHLELPLLLRHGAGERPALVPEQLAFEERLGERRAVDRHERAAGARAVLVDGPRHELLPGAALARQEDRRVGLRHARNERQDGDHGGALPHHAVLQDGVLDEPPVLALQPFDLPGVLEGDGGDPRDRRQQLEMGLVEAGLGARRVEVEGPEDALAERQGDGQDRVHVGAQQAGGRAEVRSVPHVVAQDRDALLEDPLGDRPADADRAPRDALTVHPEGVVDLPRRAAGDQEGAALGGNDFEDRLQEPALEGPHAADRVDRRADAQKDRQIARRASRGADRGRIAGHRSRLLPGARGTRGGGGRGRQLERRPGDDLPLVQLHRRACGRDLGVVKQDREDRVPHPHLVAVPQLALLHRDAVHERAVVAAEVGDPQPRSLPLEDAVLPRDPHAGETQAAPLIPPDGETGGIQRDRRPLPGPGDGGESRSHAGGNYPQSDSPSIRLDSPRPPSIPGGAASSRRPPPQLSLRQGVCAFLRRPVSAGHGWHVACDYRRPETKGGRPPEVVGLAGTDTVGGWGGPMNTKNCSGWYQGRAAGVMATNAP